MTMAFLAPEEEPQAPELPGPEDDTTVVDGDGETDA